MVEVGLDDPDFPNYFSKTTGLVLSTHLPHYMTYGGNPNPDLALTVRATFGYQAITVLPPKKSPRPYYFPLKTLVANVLLIEELP